MIVIQTSLLLLFVSTSVSIVSSYNILGIFPMPAKNHFNFIDPLMVGLAKRGHQVTSYNPFPKTYKIPNYTDVHLEGCFLKSRNHLSISSVMDMAENPFFSALMMTLLDWSPQNFGNCVPLVQLLNSTIKYDLLLTESFFSDSTLIYAVKFNIPFITFVPSRVVSWLAGRTGNPSNPSYIPNIFLGGLSRMNFIERVQNTLLYVQTLLTYNLWNLRDDEKVFQHFLGENAPSVYDVVKNTSLVFMNAPECLSPISPSVPSVVNVGGIHIKPVAGLPKDIEKFINESTHGVVYFCMGSLLRGETFPEEKRNAFLRAFARLPQRVLWKWEGDTLPGKPDNIMIAKWMPQRDILAHPNVKLFISHGGLLGTSEAVYEGVPILGIPIFGDQRTNLKSIESNGAGEILDYNEISEEVVYEKITRLLNNPQYKKDAVDLSIRYKDRPMSPLDTAVYWTEYVIRHKGAPHLKTAAVHMPWYEYLLLDVIAFLFVVLVTALIMIYYTLKFTLRFIYNMIFGGKNRQHESQKKIKRS